MPTKQNGTHLAPVKIMRMLPQMYISGMLTDKLSEDQDASGFTINMNRKS